MMNDRCEKMNVNEACIATVPIMTNDTRVEMYLVNAAEILYEDVNPSEQIVKI